MYAKFFKRLIDFLLSLIALIILSPLLAVLIILGAVFMRGNPFFTQDRPGRNEKIFKLIKFRTMDNRKDDNGNLLPDEVRLNKYGLFLRASSLDELPELAEWKKELPDNVNLIGLLVDVDEKGSDQYKLAEKIIKETGADYQHLIATEEFDDMISNLVGVPTTFFVDSTGKIIGEPFAGADVDAYKQTVEDYLNGK